MKIGKALDKAGDTLRNLPNHPIVAEETPVLLGAAAAGLAIERLTGSEAAGRVGRALVGLAAVRVGWAAYDTVSPSESGPAPALHQTHTAQVLMDVPEAVSVWLSSTGWRSPAA